MIDFFFGKPRTGKSYRAVKLIYDDYIADSSTFPKFQNILTNIGGFKFKEINEMFLFKGSKSVAYKLIWKEFYQHLRKMYEMAMDDKSDEELNKYANYHKINDCLIVIDEASLYLKKYDDAISWYLAYHGHFKVRIVIIAQSPKQINAEYMAHTEIFYDAQPQAKQLKSNSLRYIHYSDIPFNKDNKFSSNTIKTSQDIYDLYKSGEVDKPKKIIYKFIGIAIFAILMIYILAQYFVSHVKETAHIVDEPQNSKTILDKKNNFFSNDGSLLNIRCNESSCWLVDDKYEIHDVTLTYFKYVVFTNDLQLSFSEVKNEIYKLINMPKGQKKVTLAYLTDYYYFVPYDVQKSYLSKFFIPIQKIQSNNTLKIDNPFSSDTDKKTDSVVANE